MQNLFDRMESYLERKSERTPEESSILLDLKDGHFPIISLHRDDLVEYGFDVRNISDGDMVDLARKLNSDYCEQLFGDSLKIIAEDMDLPRHPMCPRCEEKRVEFRAVTGVYSCRVCGQSWNDFYVLVEHPDSTSFFWDNNIGYPCTNTDDSQARYVPQYDYIRHFRKEPDPGNCFKPVCWPDSQKYMPQGNPENESESDSNEALCEQINDEKGMADFDANALWVLACDIQNK